MKIPKTCNRKRRMDLRFQHHVYSTNLHRKYILSIRECFIEVLIWKNQKWKHILAKLDSVIETTQGVWALGS